MAQRNQQSFDAMRQDAIRRSREMHRRAAPEAPERTLSPVPPAPEPPPKPVPPDAPALPEGLRGLLTDWDSEKLALAGLLYLLWKEGADTALLLALAYVLL